MWKRPSRFDRRVQPLHVAVEDGLVELARVRRGPGLQMAGSLAGAVPGSSPLHVMPRRTTLKPSRAISEASATREVPGFSGSG